MLMRKPRLSVMVVAAIVLTGGITRGMGSLLGESKEELKLQYDVTVQDQDLGTGRVNIIFTLSDEGRLKPLELVELCIPAEGKDRDGGRLMDLVVAIDMHKNGDGKQVARVHVRKDLAERAELLLQTHTMDGKRSPDRLTCRIPIAQYMKNAPATTAPAPTGRQSD